MSPKSTRAVALAKQRQLWADTFPKSGNVRANQSAAYCRVALSTWWLYVKQGKIKKPTRFGSRVSVWDAQYVRNLAKNGFQQKEAENE